MAKIRYGVAMSLDGFIAGPNGEADWIVVEPDFDFVSLWAQFDTFLMGRRTYEAATKRMGTSWMKGMTVAIASRTLQPSEHPGVTIIRDLSHEALQSLRAKSKKDIWLFGGGELARDVLNLGELDQVEISLIPVLLGKGIPLVAAGAGQSNLKLAQHKVYPSGRVQLIYEVPK
jgi:dihydrofolate reductase